MKLQIQEHRFLIVWLFVELWPDKPSANSLQTIWISENENFLTCKFSNLKGPQ